MTLKLFFGALTKFILGFLLVALLIFLPAGTLAWQNGWLFIGILFIPMLIAGVTLMLKSPGLLRKRLNAKEERGAQSLVIKLGGLMFLISFILAGLDFRFSWFQLPGIVVYTASGIFLVAYALYAEVMRENAYLSRTVEVQKGQKVIDTGLYGVVRHPMYSATLLLFLSMPLVLGSLIALAPMLFYPVIIGARIKDEEKLLAQELAGYAEYTKKVRYRLVPFVW